MTQPGDIITMPEPELRIWRRWFFMLLGRPVPLVAQAHMVTHTTAGDWSVCVECGDQIREPITASQVRSAVWIALSWCITWIEFGDFVRSVAIDDAGAGRVMINLLFPLVSGWCVSIMRSGRWSA